MRKTAWHLNNNVSNTPTSIYARVSKTDVILWTYQTRVDTVYGKYKFERTMWSYARNGEMFSWNFAPKKQ